MSVPTAYRHYLRALSRWPKDALRPHCQLQDRIRKRLDQRFLPSSPSTTTPPKLVDQKAELEQVNALYSLLENRYSRKFSLTGSLMRPASKPTHYADLVKELDEAPKRGFWERTRNKWKGFLRFS